MLRSIVLCSFIVVALSAAEEGAWVRLAVEEGKRGDATYMYFGQVQGSLDDLQRRLKGEDFIVVSNLRCYVDKKWMRWSEWDPMLQDVVLIRPSRVIAIMPLSGDPLAERKEEKKADAKALF